MRFATAAIELRFETVVVKWKMIKKKKIIFSALMVRNTCSGRISRLEVIQPDDTVAISGKIDTG